MAIASHVWWFVTFPIWIPFRLIVEWRNGRWPPDYEEEVRRKYPELLDPGNYLHRIHASRILQAGILITATVAQGQSSCFVNSRSSVQFRPVAPKVADSVSRSVPMLNPPRWRKQVETRLGELQSELAEMQGASEERVSLERRIASLSQELGQLDEDDEERGTQWRDSETGAAADM